MIVATHPTPEAPSPATPSPDAPSPFDQTDSTVGGRRLCALIVAIAIVVVLADQGTKWWAEATLGDGHTITVIDRILSFQLVYNPGAAFSMGTGFTWVFTIVAAIASVAIAWYAWRVRSAWWALALGLLLGGALTHLGDRLFRQPGFARGHVVDFIDYGGLFIGNVADIALVFGAILVVVINLFGVRASGTNPKPAP